VVLKALTEGEERRLAVASERERDIVVRHLGFGVSPGEAKEAMGRHVLDPQMRRVFDPYDGPLVVQAPERPAPDLLESDRVRMPTG
jgi:hypothetical protein